MNDKIKEAFDKIGSISAFVAENCGNADTAKYMNDIISIVRESVSEPLKNCNVGTADEQYERFVYCCSSRKIPCRKSYTQGCVECYAKWSQRPYEKE
jgi:hypothetical protein